MTEMLHPGWLLRLLTHRVKGLEHYARLLGFYGGQPRPVKGIIEV